MGCQQSGKSDLCPKILANLLGGADTGGTMKRLSYVENKETSDAAA